MAVNTHSGQPCPYSADPNFRCSLGISHGNWYECQGYGMPCPYGED